MRHRTLCGVAAFIALVGGTVSADRLVLESGRTMEGQILQESDSKVSFRLDHGVIVVPRSMIKSLDKSAVVEPIANPESTPPANKTAAMTTPAASASRMPNWQRATASLARQPWATNLMPIPATVIDKGQMRAVPYSSYRCGEDYEVNVYGDPDAPAGVEIGIYRHLLTDDKAKQNCIDFISSILSDKVDAGIVRIMDRGEDLVERRDLTIEITPPTADDAYGGWWVSVYSTKALDAARATPTELKQITVTKASAVQKTAVADTTSDTLTDWQAGDMQNARSSSASSGGAGGSVYVRGYYRKNGTYVNSYNRSASGAGHSHHR